METSAGTRHELRLARWTCTTGSSSQSRAAVVVETGDHVWEASADGNGAVSALLHAVDRALSAVLAGRPRLVSYAVTALGEGPDAQGRVAVEIAPPEAAAGRRAGGTYRGTCEGPNTIACSVEAYLDALNAMLGEEQWAGATEAPGDRHRRDLTEPDVPAAELDRDVTHDPTSWFER